MIVPLSPTAKEETAGVEWYDSGIGFAIPIDDVLASFEKLKRGKDLYPGLLGVNMKEGGIDERPTIDHVRYDSPAEKAGLKAGDVLTEIDHHPIVRHDEVKQVLGRKYAGDRVAIVVRRGGATVRADVTLTDALASLRARIPGNSAGTRGLVRVRAASLCGLSFRSPRPPRPELPPAIAIEKWNGKEVAGADQLSSAVRRLRPGTTVSVEIVHGGDSSHDRRESSRGYRDGTG